MRYLSVDHRDIPPLRVESIPETHTSPNLIREMTNGPDKVNAVEDISKTKLLPLAQMKLYQEQNKHTEVLNLLNSMKKKNILLIDADIISVSVISATAVKQPQTIVSLIDFGQSQGVKINAELALAYIKACKECSVDSQPGMWSKAVGMLEIILAATDKGNGRIRTTQKAKPSDIIAQCFEETVVLCANSRKWRNVLDSPRGCSVLPSCAAPRRSTE
jgi:hypothetical protein